jgi:hypothetical protein
MKSLSRAVPNGASRRCNGEAMLVIRFVLGEIHPLDGNSCRNSVVIPQKRRTPLHFGSGVHWLRGADLNRRPLGYAI